MPRDVIARLGDLSEVLEGCRVARSLLAEADRMRSQSLRRHRAAKALVDECIDLGIALCSVIPGKWDGAEHSRPY